jgi:hypothetical protein
MRQVREPHMTDRTRTVAMTIAVMAITFLPYIYAHLITSADLVYTGLMFDVPDHAQYWSWVTASRKALFISNTMTPEVNNASFMNPMMWLLAQVQNGFGLSFPSLFQWWRVAVVVLLMPLIVAFVRVMVVEPDRRATALTIAVLGSGLGWFLIVLKKLAGLPDVPWPGDLYTVESNTFWAILGYPYISWAHALILATMLGAWLASRNKDWRYGLLAAIAAAALSVSHAYDLVTVYVVLSVYGLVIWARERRFPLRLAIVGLAIVACSAPAALYYQRLTSGDPLWRAVLGQYSNAGVWTPPHMHLIVLMGVPLLLAAAGVFRRTRWSDEQCFLATWTATGLILIYLPVVYQIKLLSGLQFPIAILAANGWHERIRPGLERWVPARWAAAALVVMVAATNVYLFAWRFVDLNRRTAPYYLHRDEVDALDWLSQNASQSDVVIAEANVGQFVPNYGASRAYLAHWAMTNRFYERRANVEAFFAPYVSDEWRHQLLTGERITLVMRTDWPTSQAEPYDPGRSPGFDLVFSRPRAQIYRVKSEGLERLAEGPRAQ